MANTRQLIENSRPDLIEFDVFENVTLGRDLVKKGMDIEFVSFSEDHIMADIDKGACGPNTNLEMTLRIPSAPEDLLFVSSGKVERVDELEEGRVRLLVKLFKFDHDLWEEIVHVQEKRRDRIDKIFEAVRGY